MFFACGFGIVKHVFECFLFSRVENSFWKQQPNMPFVFYVLHPLKDLKTMTIITL